MIEALFYGERPIAYGSSLINDTFIDDIMKQQLKVLLVE
jgi:hypothetical protein